MWFSSASLAQLHNSSNASKLPNLATWCHAMYPHLSLATNNLFFNSFRHSCTSLAQTHRFCNISTWLSCAATCKAVYPLSYWAGKSSLGLVLLPYSNTITVAYRGGGLGIQPPQNTKLQLSPKPLTRGPLPSDPSSLCPLSSAEFVEPPNKIPGYATAPLCL
jgi:hypothetical protein